MADRDRPVPPVPEPSPIWDGSGTGNPTRDPDAVATTLVLERPFPDPSEPDARYEAVVARGRTIRRRRTARRTGTVAGIAAAAAAVITTISLLGGTSPDHVTATADNSHTTTSTTDVATTSTSTTTATTMAAPTTATPPTTAAPAPTPPVTTTAPLAPAPPAAPTAPPTSLPRLDSLQVSFDGSEILVEDPTVVVMDGSIPVLSVSASLESESRVAPEIFYRWNTGIETPLRTDDVQLLPPPTRIDLRDPYDGPTIPAIGYIPTGPMHYESARARFRLDLGGVPPGKYYLRIGVEAAPSMYVTGSFREIRAEITVPEPDSPSPTT